MIDKILENTAIKLYGLGGKQDLEVRVEDMVLSIKYDKPKKARKSTKKK